MIPNLPDYKIITIPSTNTLNFHLKTTYTTPQSSIFNFNFFSDTSNVQKYPIVCKIDENSQAYKQGLRVGHTLIKLNNHYLEYKDVKTVLSDFIYEKKNSQFIKLTIL